MTFGERLRALRIERGLTIGKLAARASMYTAQVHAYENGKRVPRSKVLAMLAQALDVSREALAGDENERN